MKASERTLPHVYLQVRSYEDAAQWLAHHEYQDIIGILDLDGNDISGFVAWELLWEKQRRDGLEGNDLIFWAEENPYIKRHVGTDDIQYVAGVL